MLLGMEIRFSVGDCRCRDRNELRVLWSDDVISFGDEELFRLLSASSSLL